MCYDKKPCFAIYNTKKMVKMEKYVGYIRVSTRAQGNSGYSLGGQQYEIEQFIKNNQGTVLLDIFKDVSSGANNARVGINCAISLCREEQATLLVAKLDRLSRSVSFIFALKESGVKFRIIDMPNFNSLSLGIQASFAESERDMIVERALKTKATKIRLGIKMGNSSNFSNEGREKGRSVIQERIKYDRNRNTAARLIAALRDSGYTFAAITKELNALKIPTLRNSGLWSVSSVASLYNQTIEGKRSKVLSSSLTVVSVSKSCSTVYSLEGISSKIQKMVSDNLSLNEIAKYLNKEGIRTPNGSMFYAQTVKRFIKGCVPLEGKSEEGNALCSPMESSIKSFVITYQLGSKVRTKRFSTKSLDTAKKELLAVFPRATILEYAAVDRQGKKACLPIKRVSYGTGKGRAIDDVCETCTFEGIKSTGY